MTNVLVTVATEDGTDVVEMTVEDATEVKKLLKKAQRNGEWDDKIDIILDRSKRLETIGTIVTMSDGFGWYRNYD